MATFDLRDTNQTIRAVQEGLPAQTVADLRTRLGLSWTELANALLVGERTLQRRLRDGDRLAFDVSDRVAELLWLVEHATDVLGPEATTKWLTTPHPELDTTPLRYA